MEHRHLWLRTPRQSAILRVRATIMRAAAEYFDTNGFIRTDPPILTPNACEGTSELFEMDYFDDDKAYLTQSGQLYVEATALALGKVYSFGPTFRAEKSKTRRHLTEFWMVEPEVAHLELNGLHGSSRSLHHPHRHRRPDPSPRRPESHRQRHHQTRSRPRPNSLRQCRKRKVIEGPAGRTTSFACYKIVIPPSPSAKGGSSHLSISNALPPRNRFPRLSYDEAHAMLERSLRRRQNRNPPQIRRRLRLPRRNLHQQPIRQARHDPPLPRRHQGLLHAARPQDPTKALCVDVLAPEGYGEIIGGSQRVDSYDLLKQRIEDHNLPLDAFQWYLDLRKYGSVPHAGFGMGIERVVAWLCGLDHVRETIPFARTLNRIYP